MNIGILNLMPDGHDYEQELCSLFVGSIDNIVVRKITSREMNVDNTSDSDLESDYYSYSELVEKEWIDVLIITGAPVEKKNFEDLKWWACLNAIILDSINRGIYILGICWGGMAVAKILGIEKSVMNKKIFGLKNFKNIVPDHPLMQGIDQEFYWPVSTHAILSHDYVQRKIDSGNIYGLGYNDSIGYGLLVSADLKNLICLAHPEYRAERLLAEYRRDWGVDLLEPDFLHHNSADVTFNQAIDKTPFFRWFKFIEKEISLRV